MKFGFCKGLFRFGSLYIIGSEKSFQLLPITTASIFYSLLFRNMKVNPGSIFSSSSRIWYGIFLRLNKQKYSSSNGVTETHTKSRFFVLHSVSNLNSFKHCHNFVLGGNFNNSEFLWKQKRVSRLPSFGFKEKDCLH